MSAKRYIAPNLKNYLMGVTLPGGVTMTLRFNSGFGQGNNAFYITSDETIQKALERDVRYGRSFKLVQIDGVPIEEYNAIKSKGFKSDISLTVVEEITTVGAARQYLSEKYNSKVTNRIEVFAECEKLNVSFPNLPKE